VKRSSHLVSIQLVLVAALLSYPCGASDDVIGVRETEAERDNLVDGVYPVVTDDTRLSAHELASETVKLSVLALDGNKVSAPKIRILKRPLLRFKRSIHFGFKFENNECTQVEFDNTDKLKAFSREHAPTRLAVVVGNQIVTHHKLRGPIESEKVRITCCTEGGGDHLRKHLMRIESSSASNAKSTVDE
jgi:hypothetical protein